MKSGVLVLKKEKGFTSHDAVARVRRLFGTRKVGHTGTLDPQATGVLPILVGNAVKACDLIPGEEKQYLATLHFGILTDTEDIWGQVLEQNEIRPTREALCRAVAEFPREYGQIPPMVSAVKVGGKKLYQYAREGKNVERAPRPVKIHSLELLSYDGQEASLRATVSRGTYIRTLLLDLCRQMGVLGTMSALERERSGPFDASAAVTLAELEELAPEERENRLIPTEELFSCYPPLTLPDFYHRLVANGCAVRIEKLSLEGEAGDRYRLYQQGKFFALAEIFSDAEGKKLRVVKAFPFDL